MPLFRDRRDRPGLLGDASAARIDATIAVTGARTDVCSGAPTGARTGAIGVAARDC